MVAIEFFTRWFSSSARSVRCSSARLRTVTSIDLKRVVYGKSVQTQLAIVWPGHVDNQQDIHTRTDTKRSQENEKQEA
ncbi:hypothetical protein CCS92_33685, partial [Methylobacterium radiotolerans]